MADEKQSIENSNTVTIEAVAPCKKRVCVEVPAETVKSAWNKHYDQLRTEALVPGFRKGRAPRRLLEKKFGKETADQVKAALLLEASRAALEDNNLDILDEPEIDPEKIQLPEDGPMKFDFEVEVRPEFELPAIEGIEVQRTDYAVTEKHIDAEIEQLRRQSGTWQVCDRPAAADDQIVADTTARIDGIEEPVELRNVEIYIRPNGFVGEIPVAELDKLLAGAVAGDTRKKTFNVAETYFREQYRGKKVDLEIKVNEVKSLNPADLDDDFASRLGASDIGDLREKIQDMLQYRLEQQSRSEVTDQVYKYLLDNTNLDLPTDLVARQAAMLLKRQYASLLAKGLSRQQIDQRMEQLQAGTSQQATGQLKVYFIMEKIAEKLDINVTEEEINGHIAQLAIRMGQRPERLKEDLARDGSLAQLRVDMREEKCIARLLESAAKKDVKPKAAASPSGKAPGKTARKSKSAKPKGDTNAKPQE